MSKTNWTEVDRSDLERGPAPDRFAGDDDGGETDEATVQDAYNSGRRSALWQAAYDKGLKAGKKAVGKIAKGDSSADGPSDL